MKEKGFSLIELMLATALVGLTSLAGYSFYVNTFQFQALQERQKEMQTRLQLAMNILVSDIRATGFGVMDPRSSGTNNGMVLCAGALLNVPQAQCNPVTPGNSTPTTTDIITLSERFRLLGTLSAPVSNGANTIFVTSPAGSDNIPAGTLITIGGFFTATTAAATTATSTFAGNPMILATSTQVTQPGNAGAYPIGMSVYSVGNVVYGIGPAPGFGLFSNDGLNNTLIVPGIEDLQVAYFLNGNPALSSPQAPAPPTNNPAQNLLTAIAGVKNAYLAIRVSLIARVNDPQPTFTGGQRPLLEDHQAGAAGDNFRRAVLTRIVELPSDGCGPSDRFC